jgi:hypothetical protein
MFNENPTRIMGSYMKTCLTFMILSRLITLVVKNVSDKMRRENQYTFSVTFSRKSCLF